WIDKPPAIRALLQEYGTEVRRRDRADYWTQAWAWRLPVGVASVVVPDMRFPNEAAQIRGMSGQLWQVIRPGYDWAPGVHASESMIDTSFDVVFQNASTLDYLHAMVDVVI